MESGNVYLPHPAIAPWVEAFVEECSTFPNGKYDDQVDQMTQVLNRLRRATSPAEKPAYRPRRRRAASGDGWRDLRESKPLWQAVPQIRDAVSGYATGDPELDR